MGVNTSNQNTRESPILLVSIVRSGSNDIDVDIRDAVTAFKYTDSDKKADKCTFTVRNHDLSNFDKPLWKKGAKLRVQWGYNGAVGPARTVVIESVKGFSVLTVEAHSIDVLMNKTKRPRVFRDVTRSDVAAKIAAEFGYDDNHQFIQPTTKLFPQISQGSKTDAQLLAFLAKKEQFVFYTDFDGFHWHERDVKQAPSRRYIYGASVQISEMIIGEPSIENDITVPRYKGIRRKGIDKETGEPFDEVASNTDTERDGLAPELDNIDDVAASELDMDAMAAELAGVGEDASELGSGEDGAWISNLVKVQKDKVKAGLAASKEAQYQEAAKLADGGASYNPELYTDPLDDDDTGFSDPDASANYHYIEQIDADDETTKDKLEGAGYVPIDESGSAAQDAEEAKNDADSKYKRAQLTAVKLKFDVYGDAHLLGKTVIRFDAWGQTRNGPTLSKRISGLYYVSEVEHDITRGNYVCHLECRTDGGGTTGGAKVKTGSAANLNKDSDEYPVGQINVLEEIDPDSEETRLIWSDSHGRPWSSMEDNATSLPDDISLYGPPSS